MLGTSGDFTSTQYHRIDIINPMNLDSRVLREAGRPNELLKYLSQFAGEQGRRLPSIGELAAELQISTGKLREQLEVARNLGLVTVQPKTGIHTLAFDFMPGIWTSLSYALTLAPDYFEQFSALRNHVEASFWHEAVEALTDEDIKELTKLVDLARSKLEGDPVQIPHDEHRELHLRIYSRLDNSFVIGILRAYWEAYEQVGLHVYTDYAYLHQVWDYHAQIVEAIAQGNFDAGHETLIEHSRLISIHPSLERHEIKPALENRQ
jgi:DNA-binding FadR family transcriptional regulator